MGGGSGTGGGHTTPPPTWVPWAFGGVFIMVYILILALAIAGVL